MITVSACETKEIHREEEREAEEEAAARRIDRRAVE
jgi:hypothetical protein